MVKSSNVLITVLRVCVINLDLQIFITERTNDEGKATKMKIFLVQSMSKVLG